MDLICQRYPGTKPSDYLGIEDEFTAFQLDAALAIKGMQREQKIRNYHISLIDWHILQVCRSLGAKGIPKQPPKLELDTPIKPSDELPSLKDVLARLGGTGTVTEFKK